MGSTDGTTGGASATSAVLPALTVGAETVNTIWSASWIRLNKIAAHTLEMLAYTLVIFGIQYLNLRLGKDGDGITVFELKNFFRLPLEWFLGAGHVSVLTIFIVRSIPIFWK